MTSHDENLDPFRERAERTLKMWTLVRCSLVGAGAFPGEVLSSGNGPRLHDAVG